MVIFLAGFSVTVLNGCSIFTRVDPVETKIAEVCIKNNPAVLMGGFLPELRSQIETHGIKTRVFDKHAPKDCLYQLLYTANWRWDFAMWLTYAELAVYESEHRNRIGVAIYDARDGNGLPDKFGPTADKLRTLTDSLFRAAE
jgi:hypothetical protein